MFDPSGEEEEEARRGTASLQGIVYATLHAHAMYKDDDDDPHLEGRECCNEKGMLQRDLFYFVFRLTYCGRLVRVK